MKREDWQAAFGQPSASFDARIQQTLNHLEVKKMKKYEVMFILDNALEDEKKTELIDMAKEVIAADGEVTKEDVWGARKLAYPIEKKFDGYYVVLEFNAGPELPKELERKLRITDGVMRQMIICKED